MLLEVPDWPSAWRVPDKLALPKTTIMTAFDPVKLNVTPAATVKL